MKTRGRHHGDRRRHPARGRRPHPPRALDRRAERHPGRRGRRATEFEPTEFLTKKEVRRADRFTQFALVASDEALAEAGWEGEKPYAADRIGCIIGTGIGGIGTLTQNHQVLLEQGPGKVSPLAIPLMMGNAGAGAVSMRHGLRGPSYATLSACAAGAHAIGDSARMIEHGDADAMVTGGSEAALVPLARAAFAALDALSDTGISRPFDVRRDGFVMGEGAAVLILEDAEKARARGASILGYVRGYGASSDAYHLTAPEKDGGGAVEAMQSALADAGLQPEDIVYVNAHGTSTPLNDRAETVAIKTVLGEHAHEVARLVHQVGHRAPARRGRRGRGRGHAARAARPDRAADARARGARGGPGPRLRAGQGPPAGDRRQARHRDVERASASAATTPCCSWRRHDDRAGPARRREALAGRAPGGAVRPGVPARCSAPTCARAGWASARRRATA